jgi:hypothetical protein
MPTASGPIAFAHCSRSVCFVALRLVRGVLIARPRNVNPWYGAMPFLRLIQLVDKSGSLELLDNRIIDELFRLCRFGIGAGGKIKYGLHGS